MGVYGFIRLRTGTNSGLFLVRDNAIRGSVKAIELLDCLADVEFTGISLLH